jgi:hypothetical protein
MKRALAAVVLISALGVLTKLALKAERPAPAGLDGAASGATADARAGEADRDEAQLLARYPDESALVRRVLGRYRRTALEIERAEGLRGLRLLDRLDLEAIYLFEKHPEEFRRLASAVGDDAAADLLVHWSAYFGLKRADDVDRATLIAEIARLSPGRRRLAAAHPGALPLLLAEPEGASDLLRRLADEPEALAGSLALLDFVSLADGPESLRRALAVLETDRELALDCFRRFGPEGFALAALYAPVLRALGDGMPLDDALVVLKVNSDEVDALLRTRPPESVARLLRHVASAGLVEAVGGSPHGLRLAAEFGEAGDRALRRAGADAADVVFDDVPDPGLRAPAVEALGRYGPMAAAMIAKYGDDPDFRFVLARDGAAAIPPIARADVAPEVLLRLQQKPRRSFTESLAKEILSLSGEDGQAAIRAIRRDGLARVEELDATGVEFYQFLPLYDLAHLADVVRRGHAPTGGELAWAALDGAFVVADVLSLSALQPEGAAASEAARSEVKAATREAIEAGGRELVEEAAGAVAPGLARRGAGALATGAAGRSARWWAVRSAGGTFAVLRRLPEALDRLGLAQLTEMARPLARKAGLRLSTWAPVRLARNGQSVVLGIPRGRWAKYVGVNLAQAGVGVVAMHKMEEYLASKRPQGFAD